MNVRDTFGYWLVEILRCTLGWMPRVLARQMVGSIAWCVCSFHGRIRRAGEQRLNLALPEFDVRERRIFLRGIYRHLGWQVVEFCRMPRYTVRNTIGRMHAEGLDRFRELRARGKGVLILTSHLGAWELMSFYLSLRGYPTSMVVPRIDNRQLDYFVNGIRCLHGNRVITEDDLARRPLTAVNPNETVSVPMYTNVLLQHCVVVKTFNQDSCASSGLAALH
jgi:Kdo2-lipid IVA lauroyltransferase/acyltransferase